LDTVTKRLYEAMFLVDSAVATDWDGIIKTIQEILKRAEAEIVSLSKWGERKLAYEIDHKTRGTYILCYFRADTGRIREIERAIQLSERIMRVLILSVDKQKIAKTEKPTSETPAEESGPEQERDIQAEQAVAAQPAEETMPAEEPAESEQQDSLKQSAVFEDQNSKQDSEQQPAQDDQVIGDL
jgi:small subunit ribosomal protein S6